MITSFNGIISRPTQLPSPADIIEDFDFSNPSTLSLSGSNIVNITGTKGVVSSQATTALQPIFSASGGANNLPYATFSGGQKLAGALLTSSTNFTMFIVRKLSGTGQQGLFQNGNTTSSGYGFVDFETSLRTGMLYPGVSFDTSNYLPSYVNTRWEVFAGSHSSGLNKLYNTLAMSVINTAPTVNPNTPTGGHLIGFLNFGGVATFNGGIERIILYNRQLTDAEVLAVNNVLIATYDLPLPKFYCSGGDSITAGTVGGFLNAFPYKSFLSLRSGAYYFCHSNTGVGGRTSANVISALSSEVIAAYQPRVTSVYTLMIGHNDISTGVSANTLYANIISICGSARTAGYKVIICTILISTVETGDSTKLAILDDVNNRIRTNWATFADDMFDARALTNLQDPSNTTWFVDGVHPTTAGQADIAAGLYPKIAAF